MNQNAAFTSGSLFRHITVASFTSSVGLMAIFAVDLIDLLFISVLGIDELAAAAGYASTVMFFASSINIGTAIATSALVSTAVGAGDEKLARERATSFAALTIVVGIVVPVLILLNVDWLVAQLGAEGAVATKAVGYLWIVIPFTIFSGLSMVAVSMLRAHGDVKIAMYPSIFGAITNAVLDPILIFALGLGLPGAAWATAVARVVTFAFAMYPALKTYKAFAWPELGFIMREMVNVLRFTLPAVVANMAFPVGMAILTWTASRYGSEAVAGMAIVLRILPVAFAVARAAPGAIAPIIGQNYGASNMERVRQAYLDGIKFSALYVLAIMLLLFIFRQQVADLFSATGETREMILFFCSPLCTGVFFTCVIAIGNGALNSLGRPMLSPWIDWGRNTIGTLPFVLIGPQLLGGPEGILLGYVTGGAIFAGCSYWLMVRTIDSIEESQKPEANRVGTSKYGHSDAFDKSVGM